MGADEHDGGGGSLDVAREERLEKKAVRYRHDGFTPAKRRRFIKVLTKTGCFSDAARAARISTTTADRWRRKDARFAQLCEVAIEKAQAPLETLAWERGVTGIEEPIWYYGKMVGTRIKRSDGIFRLLLQGSNRRKYGRSGAVAQQLSKKEMKALREEIRAEILGEVWSPDAIAETNRSLHDKLEILRRRRLRDGRYFEAYPGGPMIPAGWRPPEGFAPGEWREPGDPAEVVLRPGQEGGEE